MLALSALEPAPLGDTPGKQATLVGFIQKSALALGELGVMFFSPL